MRLKYYIEFMEQIEDVRDMADDELRMIKGDIEKHLKKYVGFSGANRMEDFKLDLELEY